MCLFRWFVVRIEKSQQQHLCGRNFVDKFEFYMFCFESSKPHKCDLVLKNAKMEKKNIVLITINDNSEQKRVEWKLWMKCA